MIYNIKDDPFFQVSSQEPSTSSRPPCNQKTIFRPIFSWAKLNCSFIYLMADKMKLKERSLLIGGGGGLGRDVVFSSNKVMLRWSSVPAAMPSWAPLALPGIKTILPLPKGIQCSRQWHPNRRERNLRKILEKALKNPWKIREATLVVWCGWTEHWEWDKLNWPWKRSKNR